MQTVSIIVPCFNGEKYIDRCMSSIYRQTYPTIEVIVVDDGSTDESREKIEKWVPFFQKKEYVLKYIYQENGGSGSAVNTGLKYTNGEYITLLDIDDEYLECAIEERVQYLQEHKDVDVVRTNGWIVRESTKFLFTYDNDEKKREDVFLMLLRGESYNWAGSFMVRSKPLFEFYRNREIYRSRYGQNLQLLLPLLYKKLCGYIDRPHMNYIQIGNSLCRTDDRNQMKKRSLENARGYRDIRIYMVNLIVKGEREKEFYLKAVEAGYWKGVMNVAAMEKDKVLMRQAYKNKEKYEGASLDDKITYYSMIAPSVSYLYRIVRKINSLLTK